MSSSQVPIGLTTSAIKKTSIPAHLINSAQTKKKKNTLLVLSGLLVITGIVSLSKGAVYISMGQTLAIITNLIGLHLPWEYSYSQQVILESIRAPRIIMGILVGGVLAVSGAAMQGLFRNPLADPALIGISSGATFAAVAVIVLETSILQGLSLSMGLYSLPASAFVGGFVATWLVYYFATEEGYSDVSSLLLAGIAINALAGSATGLLIYMADNEQLRTITFWTMGSLSGISWQQVQIGAPFLLCSLFFIPFFSRALNALLLGEAEAGHLGFSVETVKMLIILLVALGVGTTVAFSGVIGFIGLVVPHLLRLWMGPDHQSLLPCSVLLGAILLLIADLIARTVVTPAELPIGIITGILGGPFFLWLLRRQRITSEI